MESMTGTIIGKSISVRPETNGITVYDKTRHNFFFLEGCTTEDLKKKMQDPGMGWFDAFLHDHKDCLTENIRTNLPLYIGWQLSAECNLDCIYCFADTTLHQGNTEDIVDTAKSILALNPVCVGLSGGEPTLNRKLPEIMELFSGKVNYILNTNGTTPLLQRIIPQLKKDGSLVRISIDSTSNAIQNLLRPVKGTHSPEFDQMKRIRESVEMLLDAEVPLEIHTVVSTKNTEDLKHTAEGLIAMGVKRWHLYKMDLSPKCMDIYDQIRVPFEEIGKIHRTLQNEYGDSLDITAATDARAGNRERAILLVDSTGRFMVKGQNQEVFYVGQNPKAPTQEELEEIMNYEIHRRCYYMNYKLDQIVGL